MKLLFFIFLSSISVSAIAATWKPVAAAVDCPHTVKVLAKPGVKHVMADIDGKRYQFNSNKGENFSEESLVSHQFVNEEEKMTLTLPGYVERNPPKFDMNEDGKKIHCRMNLL